MMRLNMVRRAGLAALILLPSPALAHPGHPGSGLLAGIAHPLTGMDHLAAMVLLGLWGGLAFRRHAWACPAAFLGFMLVGFGYGAAGGALPIADLLVLSSLLLLGLALAFSLRLPLAVALPLVALCAVAHGFVHGAEMPAGGDPRGFVAGFVATTICLLSIGLGLARILPRRAAPSMPTWST